MFYPAHFIGTPIEPGDELKLLAVQSMTFGDRVVPWARAASFGLQLYLDFSFPAERAGLRGGPADKFARQAAVLARALAIVGKCPHGVPEDQFGVSYAVDSPATLLSEVTYLDRTLELGLHMQEVLAYAATYLPKFQTAVSALPGSPWRLREAARIGLAGSRLPWSTTLPEIPDHFAHASTEPGMVAFTESPEKGQRNIQTRMKPGRYLTKFYPDLSADEVRKWQALVDRDITVQFAVTAKEIVKVYTEGPDSCMAKKKSVYELPKHPCAVYGNSDLQLAYMTDLNGRPNARTLVWPEQKQYMRIYGDEDRLRPRLEAMGYRKGNCWGAKIQRIKVDGERFLMPFLDSSKHVHEVEVDGVKWLAIGEKTGKPSLCIGDSNTSGAFYFNGEVDEHEDQTRCENCEDYYNDYDTTFERVYSNSHGVYEMWCEGCAEGTTYCEATDRRYPDEYVTEVHTSRYGSEQWNVDYAESHSYLCDATGDRYSTAALPPIAMSDGPVWNPLYFIESGGVLINSTGYLPEDIPDELIAQFVETAMELDKSIAQARLAFLNVLPNSPTQEIAR